MMSDEKGLCKLFEAFERVLKKASISFECFTANTSDPNGLPPGVIDFMLG